MEETKEHIPFEITETLIEELNGFIDSKDDKAVLEQLKDVHYADIAEILDDLNLDQATYVIKLLDVRRQTHQNTFYSSICFQPKKGAFVMH